MSIKNQYNEVFEEIFKQAEQKDAKAFQTLVLTGFGSEVNRKNLDSLQNILNTFVSSYIEITMAPHEIKKRKDYKKIKGIDIIEKFFWLYLQICENDTLQSMLLNLFFIIEGKSIDTILKKWQEIYEKSKRKQSQYKEPKRSQIQIRGKRKKLLMSSAEWHDEKTLRYQKRLELEKIYGLKIGEEPDKYEAVNVRNCFAHGAYWFDDKNGNIVFPRGKKEAKISDENIIEYLFCSNKPYESPVEVFGAKYLETALAFTIGFIATYQSYVEKLKDVWCVLQYTKFADKDVPEWSFINNENAEVFKTDIQGGLSFRKPKITNVDEINYYFFKGNDFKDALKTTGEKTPQDNHLYMKLSDTKMGKSFAQN